MMDWSALLAPPAVMGAEYLVLEHDHPTDWRAFSRYSVAAFRRLAA
ncbi:hypothetical protein KM176_23155 [Pseudooceanicola sp. CBS1P-1]|uniref:Uncharacterized protein n=1 Tax=Pseudooceanicola albus TaxID=2692189 RepID=A0A6L7GBB2_9RHOB|nr:MULTISPECIES: hypothetical protein [Pseudooceanicola]MBT9386764.1 hypothetical protein [Pseudooceanicola endophyticus]MXN20972.1 hypothetical protein [Pseudooceanicola albus]